METAVCIASGPSLTQEDVDYCRGRATVFVINDNYRLAPWADALYACDLPWWQLHQGVPDFAGEKYTCNADAAAEFDLVHVPYRWNENFTLENGHIALGKNSGFQAMNLAALKGFRRIVLLGYDMQRAEDGKRHWFGEHPKPLVQNSNFAEWIRCFEKAVPGLRQHKIEVINCTRRTALECFPRASLQRTI